MTNTTPARDFLLPRLTAMIAEAGTHAISRDVAVAVLIDLVTGPGFNDTPLDPREDTAPGRHDDGPIERPAVPFDQSLDPAEMLVQPHAPEVPNHLINNPGHFGQGHM